MSGGSWDYVYSKIEDVGDKLCESKMPLRRALGKHLKLVSVALHDIEWVDSGDWGAGDEREAIEAVLGDNAKAAELEQVKEDARRILEELKRLSG